MTAIEIRGWALYCRDSKETIITFWTNLDGATQELYREAAEQSFLSEGEKHENP